MELDVDGVFKVYYADGTVYESDMLRRLFMDNNAVLAESYAKGGTGVRTDEDTDNAKYYANISRSESQTVQNALANNENILDEVKKHGMYTVFSVDFESGEVEYVSPSFEFKINKETGELDAIGQSYTFDEEVGRVIADWLEDNGVVLEKLQEISLKHSEEIADISKTTTTNEDSIATLFKRVTPVENGGTGAETLKDAQDTLGIPIPHELWVNPNPTEAFEAHEIEVDLSLYSRVHIVFSDPEGNNNYTELSCTEKNITYFAGFFGKSITSNAEVVREFKVRDTGVAFENAKHPSVSTLHNDRVIPYKIKGYKY
jgi:hypothetical protein